MNPLLAALVEAGVIDLAEAERLTRQLDPEQARLYAEGLLTDAFERGLTAQQRRLLAVVEQAEGNPTPRNLERLWAQENDLLWASVRDDLTSVAIDRAVGASIGAVDPDTWMMVNEEVVNWVDTRYLRDDPDEVGSIPNLNRTSREQFATAFQRWQLGDRDPNNFADGLPQLIAELQPIFGRARAERIAVTETTRVFAQSEIFAGNANPFIEAWLYETAADERVTPVCRSGQGRIMRKGESVFSDGMGPPPRHVRCRSSITQLTGPALAALIEDGDISGDNLPDVATLRPQPVTVTPSVNLTYRPASEQLAKVENSINQNTLRPLASQYGVTEEEIERRLMEQMHRFVDGQVPRIRASESAAESILKDGRFKTQSELSQFGGFPEFVKARKDAERLGLGAPVDLAPGLRPVYGYYDTPQHAASFYGNVEFVLKPSVVPRTTVALGDSLYAMGESQVAGMPANAMTKHVIGRESFAKYLLEGDMAESYIEAQIHGGLGIDDVAEVILHPNSYNAADLARVEAAYRQQGIKVTYGSIDDD